MSRIVNLALTTLSCGGPEDWTRHLDQFMSSVVLGNAFSELSLVIERRIASGGSAKLFFLTASFQLHMSSKIKPALPRNFPSQRSSELQFALTRSRRFHRIQPAELHQHIHFFDSFTMTGPIRASSSSSSTASTSSSIASRPLNGVFGLEKPSGPTSMSLLEALKPLFAKSILFRNPDGSVPEDRSGASAGGRGNKKGRRFRGKNKDKLQPPKIGQGGTLDPLADGVLVVGVGKGTKQLARFLDCTKEYRAIGLLGSATTSYDSQDPILYRAAYSHVSPELLLSKMPQFTGEIQQLPPLYSAIRMDGKRLFDYARQGIPLPRPIDKRNCRVEELRLVEWVSGGEHHYKEPDREVEEEEKELVGKVKEMAGETQQAKQGETRTDGVPGDAAESSSSTAIATVESKSSNVPTTSSTSQGPPTFTIEMTVSSGTYVRSIVHDLASACDSAAHVVLLTRTRQGEFSIPHRKSRNIETSSVSETVPETEVILPGNCIPWKVFQEAIDEMEQEEKTKKPALAEEDEEEAAMNGGNPKSTHTERGEFETTENGDVVLKEWEKLLLSR